MIHPARPTTLSVGLDLAKQDFAICQLLWDRTEPCKRHKAPHTPAGVAHLVQELLHSAETHGCTEIRVGMEATGAYWQPLMETLRASTALQPFTPQFFLLNPREVDAYKKCLGAHPKTDFRDAYVIADYVRDGKMRHELAVEERMAALQLLTRHRLHLVEGLVREKNRLLTTMFRKFSRLTQDSPFAKSCGATTLAVLTEFHTLDELAVTPLADLLTFLETQGHGRIADCAQVAQTLQDLAATSYRVPAALVDPLNLSLKLTLQNLQLLTQQLRELDHPIRRMLREVPAAARLQSVPGLGQVFTAGLLAEIQDITRFDGDAPLANYIGLVWHAHQSGAFVGEDLPLAPTGNRILRYYFIEAANSVRVHTPEYAAYYQRKYAESPKHPHKRALVLTARKLVRLVYLLLTTDTIYLPPAVRTRR